MTTYGDQHLLMTFHGGLPGQEVWSVGLRTAAATVAEADMQVYADYVSDCFTQFAKSIVIKGYWNARTTYLGCTLRLIDTTGKTKYLAEGLPSSSPVVGAGAGALPNQCALVVTLITGRAGRRGKGRIYLPLTAPNSPSLDTDTGGLPASQTALLLAQVALLVTALNGNKDVYGAQITKPLPAAGFRIAVQSTTAPQSGSVVSKVAVGSIIDTVRGRRNKLIEVKAQFDLPTPIFIG